jgi:hypothetical protein
MANATEAVLPIAYRTRLGVVEKCGYADCPQKDIPQQLPPGIHDCGHCHRPLNVRRLLRDEIISWSIIGFRPTR